MGKENNKKKVKKYYFNKKGYIIDNLMQIFLQINYIKQKKKINFYYKIE